jgi:hypothetical protein
MFLITSVLTMEVKGMRGVRTCWEGEEGLEAGTVPEFGASPGPLAASSPPNRKKGGPNGILTGRIPAGPWNDYPALQGTGLLIKDASVT